MNTKWLGYYERINIELLQCKDEGKDVSGYEDRIKALENLKLKKRKEEAGLILDELAALLAQEGYTYEEPSDLDGIKNARPSGPRRIKTQIPEEKLYDKILGAWLGRCSGCLLGQPIEG